MFSNSFQINLYLEGVGSIENQTGLSLDEKINTLLLTTFAFQQSIKWKINKILRCCACRYRINKYRINFRRRVSWYLLKYNKSGIGQEHQIEQRNVHFLTLPKSDDNEDDHAE